ncbi:MAG: DUF1792 domain-containing protein [Bacteroidetes bacterium]|jgi:hypothetical protein|nr:DUF1792 domain-containing protein [Bacteroidota bacterium]
MEYNNIRSKSAKETFDLLARKLSTEKKLYFIRFGDGEIEIMKGISYRNHQANKMLSRELTESFQIDDPNYLIGLSVNMPVERKSSKGVCSQYPQNDEMLHYLMDNDLIKHKKVFESQTCFTYMALFHTQQTYEFFEKHIRPRKKMFIGGTQQHIAEKLYGNIDYYVQTPLKNAYENIELWWPEVMAQIDNCEMVIVSAGVSSNVIAKRLWYENKEVQLLDIGSIIDPIDGKTSRTWIRLLGHRIQRLLPRAYREKSMKQKILYVLKDIKYLIRRHVVSKN